MTPESRPSRANTAPTTAWAGPSWPFRSRRTTFASSACHFCRGGSSSGQTVVQVRRTSSSTRPSQGTISRQRAPSAAVLRSRRPRSRRQPSPGGSPSSGSLRRSGRARSRFRMESSTSPCGPMLQSTDRDRSWGGRHPHRRRRRPSDPAKARCVAATLPCTHARPGTRRRGVERPAVEPPVHLPHVDCRPPVGDWTLCGDGTRRQPGTAGDWHPGGAGCPAPSGRRPRTGTPDTADGRRVRHRRAGHRGVGPDVFERRGEVRATDVRSLAIVGAILLGILVLAAIVPSRRASRVDPLVALRVE